MVVGPSGRQQHRVGVSGEDSSLVGKQKCCLAAFAVLFENDSDSVFVGKRIAVLLLVGATLRLDR